MRHIIILCNVFLLALLLAGCEKEEDAQSILPTAFKKHYGGAYAETGTSIVQLDNGDFIIIGFIGRDADDIDRDLYLLRTDKYGNIIFSTSFGDDSVSEDIPYLRKCEDGTDDIIVVASNIDDTGTMYRLTNEAEIVWQKELAPSIFSSRSFDLDEEGIFVLSRDEIQYYTYSGVGKEVFVFNELLENYISQNLNNSVTSIFITDLGVAICGYRTVRRNDLGFPVGFVAMISKSGELLWENEYPAEGISVLFDVENSKDILSVVGMTAAPSTQGFLLALALRLDAENGSILCSETISVGLEPIAFSSTFLDGKDIVIAASTEYPTSFELNQDDIYIARLDEDCKIVWERNCGGNKDESVYQVVETNDGGIAAVGSTESIGGGDSDVLLIKLDKNGKLR